MVREGCCARTEMDADVSERKGRECLPVFFAESWQIGATTIVTTTDKSSSSPFYRPPLTRFY